jgi:hypothetical protein
MDSCVGRPTRLVGTDGDRLIRRGGVGPCQTTSGSDGDLSLSAVGQRASCRFPEDFRQICIALIFDRDIVVRFKPNPRCM